MFAWICTSQCVKRPNFRSIEATAEAAQQTQLLHLRQQRGRHSESEFSTPRKFTWDYSADLGAHENQGHFISTRRDLTLSGERVAVVGEADRSRTPLAEAGAASSGDTVAALMRQRQEHSRERVQENRPASEGVRAQLATASLDLPTDGLQSQPSSGTIGRDLERMSDKPEETELRSDHAGRSADTGHRLSGEEPAQIESLQEGIRATLPSEDGHPAVLVDPGAESFVERTSRSLTSRITDLMERDSPQRQVSSSLFEFFQHPRNPFESKAYGRFLIFRLWTFWRKPRTHWLKHIEIVLNSVLSLRPRMHTTKPRNNRSIQISDSVRQTNKTQQLVQFYHFAKKNTIAGSW